MELSNSSFPTITDVVEWPRGSFEFEDLTVELHGFEWAAHTDDHAAWLLPQDGIIHSSDLINPDQPPFWKFAGNERFHWHEHNLKQVYDLEWRPPVRQPRQHRHPRGHRLRVRLSSPT